MGETEIQNGNKFKENHGTKVTTIGKNKVTKMKWDKRKLQKICCFLKKTYRIPVSLTYLNLDTTYCWVAVI